MTISGIRPNLPPFRHNFQKIEGGGKLEVNAEKFSCPLFKLIVFRCLFKECEEIFLRQFLLPSLEHMYALRKIFNIEMGQGHMLNFDESFYYKFNVKNKSWGS